MLKEQNKKVLNLRAARLAICLCCLALLLTVACATGPSAVKPDDSLFGTWINVEYEGNSSFHARLISFPDGRELGYDYLSSAEPECVFNNTIEETWFDAEGNRWYKTHGTWFEPFTAHGGNLFSLNKLNAAGTVREWVWSLVDYPEELSPLGGGYCIFHRQE
jgi:hypothetical protein